MSLDPDTPLQPNPYGLPSNFDDPETNAASAIVTVSIFLALTTVMVTLRMICRVVVLKHVGLDDICSVLALLSCVAEAGCFFFLLNNNILGPHSWNVRLVDFLSKRGTGPLLSIQIVGNLANFFAKMSVLLFLHRLFPRRVSPKTSVAIWFGIFANVIAYSILTLYLIIVCVPQVGAPKPGPNVCPGPLQIRLGRGVSAVNALLDVYAFLVAVPSLWLLQMPLKKKLNVVGVLAVGLCACALSIATLVKRFHNQGISDDPAWNQVSQLVFGHLEPLLAIITACLPAMPALWTAIYTNAPASLRRLLCHVSSTTTLWSASNKSAAKQQRTDDNHSMQSLNAQGSRQSYDMEGGPHSIHVKNDFSITSATMQNTAYQARESHGC